MIMTSGINFNQYIKQILLLYLIFWKWLNIWWLEAVLVGSQPPVTSGQYFSPFPSWAVNIYILKKLDPSWLEAMAYYNNWKYVEDLSFGWFLNFWWKYYTFCPIICARAKKHPSKPPIRPWNHTTRADDSSFCDLVFLLNKAQAIVYKLFAPTENMFT